MSLRSPRMHSGWASGPEQLWKGEMTQNLATLSKMSSIFFTGKQTVQLWQASQSLNAVFLPFVIGTLYGWLARYLSVPSKIPLYWACVAFLVCSEVGCVWQNAWAGSLSYMFAWQVVCGQCLEWSRSIHPSPTTPSSGRYLRFLPCALSVAWGRDHPVDLRILKASSFKYNKSLFVCPLLFENTQILYFIHREI